MKKMNLWRRILCALSYHELNYMELKHHDGTSTHNLYQCSHCRAVIVAGHPERVSE